VNRVPKVRATDDPICGRCKAKLMPRTPVPAGDADFAQVVEASPIPVLVDFWAPWCGPCRMVAPALEAIARERGGKLKVVKVNTDEAPRLSARFGIRSIPTLALFHDGRLVAQQAGALPKASIELWLRSQAL
jgi:thioredoxin 2